MSAISFEKHNCSDIFNFQHGDFLYNYFLTAYDCMVKVRYVILVESSDTLMVWYVVILISIKTRLPARYSRIAADISSICLLPIMVFYSLCR